MTDPTIDRILADAGQLVADIEIDVEVLFARSGKFDHEVADTRHKLDRLRLILANLRGVGQALKVKIG